MLIYVITNKLNGKQYVGQTQRPLKERIYEHRHGKVLYIDRVIRKIGWENFTVEVLEVCKTLEELNEREMYWIRKLNTKKPNGYNQTDGGNGKRGQNLSEETKTRLSFMRTGEKNPNYGKPLSDWQKKRISEARTGATMRNDAHAKVSKARSKPVICVETGEMYPSTKIASESMGLSPRAVCKACSGETKTIGGFHWRYV